MAVGSHGCSCRLRWRAGVRPSRGCGRARLAPGCAGQVPGSLLSWLVAGVAGEDVAEFGEVGGDGGVQAGLGWVFADGRPGGSVPATAGLPDAEFRVGQTRASSGMPGRRSAHNAARSRPWPGPLFKGAPGWERAWLAGLRCRLVARLAPLPGCWRRGRFPRGGRQCQGRNVLPLGG